MKTILSHPKTRAKHTRGAPRAFTLFGLAVLFTLLLGGLVFSLPLLLAVDIQHTQDTAFPSQSGEFPVTVDPRNKVIVENAQVNALFNEPQSPLQAAVGDAGNIFQEVFQWVALSIASTPAYQNLASVASIDGHFVTITPGMRKEQVANAFATALGWNDKQKQEFLTIGPYASLPLPEGSFSPGVYSVSADTTPLMAQAMVNDRFSTDVLSHYGTTTAQVVPLNEALTVASLIEREAGGPDDMRIISGIIWNRLFIGMNLQIDATVQYAKADTLATGGWWPKVLPRDLLDKSPYNTYINPGLPPTPIANPSVVSILAALNPINTTCLFYFHDAQKQFHCSDTYEEHVALLKKYYGRGK